MKSVVVSIERPGKFVSLPIVIDVTVTFDDTPFEFLDEPDKPANTPKELEFIAQSIVAQMIKSGELTLYDGRQELRTHVLISGKKEGAFQVDYTVTDGVVRHNIPPVEANTSPGQSVLESALKEKYTAAQCEVKSTYGELEEQQTWRLPVIPEAISKLMQSNKKRAAENKKERDLAQEREDFLVKGPRKFPDAVAFPAAIKIIKKGDVDLEDAVKKMNASYGTKSLLEPTHNQIVIIEQAIEGLEQQLSKLKKREIALNQAIAQDPRVTSFSQNNLHASRSALQETRRSLENKISALRVQLSAAKNSFGEHVSDKYSRYTNYENTIEFTKKVMLTALYNAAIDYYKQILDETKDNVEKRKEKITEFNESFAGIAKIDEYGKVNPIEETYNKFAQDSLKEVVQFTNELLIKCSTGISSRKVNVIEAQIHKANQHCADEYKKHYGDMAYTDTKQKMPFTMEKNLLKRLKNISLNVQFESGLENAVQAASNPVTLSGEWSKIPKGDTLADQLSVLEKADKELTALERKVNNFQRYLALKDELEAKKALALGQNQQIEAVTKSLDTVRQAITGEITGKPVDVQKYVLENIDRNLARSVFDSLTEKERGDLSEVLALDRMHVFPAESGANALAMKHGTLATAIKTADTILTQIKEEDIQVEQLNQLQSALGEVGESALDQGKLDKVTRHSKSCAEDNLFVQDYLAFEKQRADAQENLGKHIADAREKFEMLKQENLSETQLLFVRTVLNSLEGMVDSFKNTQYERNQTDKNKQELQRLTELAESSYKKILSQYEQINESIKSAKKEQPIAQQPEISPEHQKKNEKQPPSPPTLRKEGEPIAEKRKLHQKPPSTIEIRIIEIYRKYAEEVSVGISRLASGPVQKPLKDELWEKYNAQNMATFKEFEKAYDHDPKLVIKKANAVVALNEIKELIEDTKWKVKLGPLTGKEIEVDGKSKIVPPHIFKIYEQAKLGMTDPQKADEAMNEINKIATNASSANFFRKALRDKQTTKAYESIMEHSSSTSRAPG
ncbi:hypothetical protein OQJ13_13115 [Legionella sp. PATHC035]|uniref:hypothetical protein n=1 Tax=Legionella sp. PATHC035 TaxID=2992040 RepID=UPI002242FC97|nr:hypothetical protein [Legionella sp. PATHC035]MCW8409913.1 hypothetical protein [Legionella sp. PATHC035]